MWVKQDGILFRHMEEEINHALDSSKMVAISGAYGSGKTTLARKMAEERGMKFVSLNDPIICQQACRNPKEFLESLSSSGGVIDEFEKAPLLGRSFKGYLDCDPRLGRFLVTSSMKKLVRPSMCFGSGMVRIELSTFSQSEIEGAGSPGGFLTHALEGDVLSGGPCGRSADLWPRVLRGGYPRAVLAESLEESVEWLKGYKNLLINQYLKENFTIRKHDKFRDFVLYLAENSGVWLRLGALARKLNVKPRTIDRWLGFLHDAYVIDWTRNDTISDFRSLDSRAGYKFHFLDSGLLASLRGCHSLDSILDPKNRRSLLRSFVYGELRKLMSDMRGLPYLRSYENCSGARVDFVLHTARGVVAVDVKASSSSLKSSDFEGLRSLKKEMKEYYSEFGDTLICGVVFHTGEETYLSDEGFYGVPVGMLWAPLQVTAEESELGVLREAAGA